MEAGKENKQDGRLRNFKPRFCDMRAAMQLGASHGWKPRQVVSVNALCQIPQKTLTFVSMSKFYQQEGTANHVVLQIKKSLYEQVTSSQAIVRPPSEGNAPVGVQAIRKLWMGW
jgi:hypothetical protein